MNPDEAQSRLNELQRIMERTTLCTLLPGASAVIGGLLALAGCAVTFGLVLSTDFSILRALPRWEQIGLCIVWVAIAVAAVAQDVALTRRAARKYNVPVVGRPGHLAAMSLTPNVLVAALLTVNFLLEGHLHYVAPVWMVCYGTGVYAAGLFSIRLPRLLGIGFIVIGALGFLPALRGYGLLLVAVTFGLMHIAFGLLVIRKARRREV